MTARDIVKVLVNAKYGFHSTILKKLRREDNKVLNRNFTAECLKVDEVFSMQQALKKMHCKKHHEAAMRGYLSRKWSAGLCEYSGRFGDGYLLVFPRFDTTNYVRAEYWIREKD